MDDGTASLLPSADDSDKRLEEIFSECAGLIDRGGFGLLQEVSKIVPFKQFKRKSDALIQALVDTQTSNPREVEAQAVLEAELQEDLESVHLSGCESLKQLVRRESLAARRFLLERPERIHTDPAAPGEAEPVISQAASTEPTIPGDTQTTNGLETSLYEILDFCHNILQETEPYHMRDESDLRRAFKICRILLPVKPRLLNILLASREFNLLRRGAAGDVRRYSREYDFDSMIHDNENVVQVGLMGRFLRENRDVPKRLLDLVNAIPLPDGPYFLLAEAFDTSPNLNPAERAVLRRMTRRRANDRYLDNFWRWRMRVNRHWQGLNIFIKAREKERRKRKKGAEGSSMENNAPLGLLKTLARVGHIKATAHLRGFNEFWDSTILGGEGGMSDDD